MAWYRADHLAADWYFNLSHVPADVGYVGSCNIIPTEQQQLPSNTVHSPVAAALRQTIIAVLMAVPPVQEASATQLH